MTMFVGHWTLDWTLYSLASELEGVWEFAQAVHICSVDLENGYDHLPRGILWVHFATMEWTARCYLFFADDMVLMASLTSDLRLTLTQFSAHWEASGKKISTSTSEAVLATEKGWSAHTRLSLTLN